MGNGAAKVQTSPADWNSLIVGGFIRRQFHLKDFPAVITTVCMEYLGYLADEWDTSTNTVETLATTSEIKLKSENGDWQTVCGTTIIDAHFPGTVVWTLEILSSKYSSMTYAYFGIISPETKARDELKFRSNILDYSYCAYNGSSESIYSRRPKRGISQKSTGARALKKGDMLEIQLNVPQKSLKFALNDEVVSDTFDKIRWEYSKTSNEKI